MRVCGSRNGMVNHRTLGAPVIRGAIALPLFALSLAGQELRGTLTNVHGAAVPAGVIVEARQASSGRRVASTLTNERGQFVLRLAFPDSVQVRGLRVGFVPSIVGDFALASGEVKTVTRSLDDAAVVLGRVLVAGRSVCGLSETNGREVATLLEEARKALRSSTLSSDGGRLSATWRTTSQLATIRGQPISAMAERTFQSRLDRPFVSVPSETLATEGYLRVRENEYLFSAPDADVLLSDQFVSSHCFRLEPWEGDARDLVGLGFRPAGAPRGVVGIQGTLWLDRVSAELRRLEFEYVNLPPELRASPAGGLVEFTRLATGAFIVNRWVIRMPRPTVREEPTFRLGRRSGTVRTLRLETMEIVGGEVTDVRAGNRSLLLFQSEAEPPTHSPGPILAINAACGGRIAEHEGVLWGNLATLGGEPLVGAVVQMEWPADFRWSPSGALTNLRRGMSVTTSSDGLWYLCRVPRGVPVDVTMPDSPTVVAWIPPSDSATRVVVDTPAVSGSALSGSVRGVAHDSLRTDRFWRGATIQLLNRSGRVRTDHDGAFQIDSVPVGAHALLAWDDELLGFGLAPAVASVVVRGRGDSARVSIATPSFASVFRAECGRLPASGEAMLVGEVRSVDGGRRAGILVRARWSRTSIARGESARDSSEASARSDSLGRFRICGVPMDGAVQQAGEVATFLSGTIQLRAAGSDVESGEVETHMSGGKVRRRDLTVSRPSQRTRLSGRVLDQLGSPVTGATVVAGGLGGRISRTDSSGRWVIDSVPLHSAQLSVRAIGYTPFRADLEPVNGRLAVGEIRLERAPQLLATVTVRGRRGDLGYREAFEDRRRSYAFGTFLDDSALARQVVVTPQFVIRQIPKARHFIGNQGPSTDPKVLVGRSKIGFEVDRGGPVGAMSLCFPRWFVDGVDFGVPEAEEEEMWLRQAKRLEVYKASLAPPQFNDFDGCGVILVWTR